MGWGKAVAIKEIKERVKKIRLGCYKQTNKTRKNELTGIEKQKP